MYPYFPPIQMLYTAAAMLHSSIMRIFMLRMVGSWLTRVKSYPSRVTLTAEAICATALVKAMAVALFILNNYS